MRNVSYAAALLAALVFGACTCSNGGGNDGGLDGGADAGPTVCTTTADCANAGTDFVCDPRGQICVPKCSTDAQCSAIADSVCEKTDGTCRAKCSEPNGDYCPMLAPVGGLICLADTGHCVEKCKQDDDCSAIKSGTRCDEPTGACITDVHGCGTDTDCNNFVEFDDYCYQFGIQCRCVIEPNDAGLNGVCHRRNRSCSECTTDVECGSAQYFEPIGACKPLQGDSSGKKYCLFQHTGGPCACGYTDNGTGFCAPATGFTCENPGCVADKDCPSGSVCNTQKCTCEPRCRWDFADKKIAAPGCAPNQECWVDNENLDPTSIYYGAGRCKPACNDDTECNVQSPTNPHGGAKLKCAAEQLVGGGLSGKRCRANGDCMDDLECPEQPESSNYYGYCDRGAFQCKTDCRVGNDPVTQKPYDDCRSPYGCAVEGTMNVCKLKTCLEQGGASIACNSGEYCCGDDKNGDNVADPCPPASDRDPAGCYKAQSPPFCVKCESNDDCKSLQVPSWQNNCPPGVISPSCSPLPVNCYGFTNPNTMEQIGVCAPATYNDPTRDMFGRGRDTKGCPATFSAVYSRIRFTQDGDDYCNTDTDCNQGGNDAGRCATDNTIALRDGGHPRACICDVGSTQLQCPVSPDGGVFSFCKAGNAGSQQACMETVSCLPGNAYVFRDAGPPFNGCGL